MGQAPGPGRGDHNAQEQEAGLVDGSLHGHRLAQGGLRAERLLIQGWVRSAKQGHRRASWERQKLGTANGNRTRISALKGPRANRCTIAARLKKLQSINYTGNEQLPKADGSIRAASALAILEFFVPGHLDGFE